MEKGVIAVLVIAALVLAGIVFTGRATGADSESDLLSKIDEVLNNQKSILSGIESLKEELNIVKIRVTQNQ